MANSTATVAATAAAVAAAAAAAAFSAQRRWHERKKLSFSNFILQELLYFDLFE